MAFVTGNGASITFGTSGYSAPIVNFAWAGRTRNPIDATTLASTNEYAYIPEALVDNGEVTLTVQHDPGAAAPISAVPETITIALPASGAGVTTPASFAFTGFITSNDPLGSVENGSIVVENITIKIDGAVTETAEV